MDALRILLVAKVDPGNGRTEDEIAETLGMWADHVIKKMKEENGIEVRIAGGGIESITWPFGG